jgi:hypothetical protein
MPLFDGEIVGPAPPVACDESHTCRSWRKVPASARDVIPADAGNPARAVRGKKRNPGFPAFAEAKPLRLRAGRHGGDAFSEPLLRRPGHDRHDADCVCGRTLNDFGADGEIDERVPFHVWHPVDARRLEEDAGLLAECFFLLGSVERSVVIGPSCRQATEKFDGSSLRPSGCPHPPFRACEMKQVTPGTLGSSKLLTQTLSLGEVNLKVVLTQARSSARARLDAARNSIADRKSGLIRLSNGLPACGSSAAQLCQAALAGW